MGASPRHKIDQISGNSIQVKVTEGGKVHKVEKSKNSVSKRSEQNNKATW